MSQEEIEILNRPITSSEIESGKQTNNKNKNKTKHLPTIKVQGQIDSSQILLDIQRRTEINSTELFHKMVKEGDLPTSFYPVSIILISKPRKN